MGRSKEIKAAIILLILHTSTAKPGKSTAPAVFEVINEQARIDDKRILPYGNPLAGNSLQNAKIHAQHQQAMFNAERMRQQRAQLQRWNKQPTRQNVDSYMKAYQESQENHHLALEQMQSNIKERKAKTRPERLLKDRPQIEPVKVTRADAVEKSRNHRSYGSIYTTVHKKHKVNTYPGPTYDQGVTIKPNGNVGLHNYEKEFRSHLYTEAIPSKTQYVYPKMYSQMHTYQSANDINTLNTLLSKPAQEQLSQLNTLIHTVKEPGKDTLNTPIELYFYVKDPQLAQIEPAQTAYGAPYAAEYNTAPNYKDHTPITEEVDDVQDDKDNRAHAYPSPTVPTILAQVNEDPTTTKSNYYKIEVEQTISGNIPKNIEYAPQEKPSYEALTYEKPLNFYLNGPSTEGVKYLQSQPTGVQHLNQDGTGVSAYGDDDVSITKNRSKREIETQYFLLGNETVTTTEKPIVNDYVGLMVNETLVNLKINCTVTVNKINETTVSDSATDRKDTIPIDYDDETTVNYFETDVNDTDSLDNSSDTTDNHSATDRKDTVFINNFNETTVNHSATDRNDTLPIAEELKREKYVAFDNAHQIGEAYEYDYAYDNDDDHSKYDYTYDGDDDLGFGVDEPDYDYDSPKTRPRPNKKPNKQRKPNVKQNSDVDGSYSSQYSNFKHPNYYDYHPKPQNNNHGHNYQYGPPNYQYGPPNYKNNPPSQQYGVPNHRYGPPDQQYGPPDQDYVPFSGNGLSLQYGSNGQFGQPTDSYGQPIQQYGPPSNKKRPSFSSHGSKQQFDPSSVIDSLEPVYMLTKSQIQELVGKPNLNIEHLDVFQVSHDLKPRRSKHPRKQKKKFRRRYPKSGRPSKLGKVRKFNRLVMH